MQRHPRSVHAVCVLFLLALHSIAAAASYTALGPLPLGDNGSDPQGIVVADGMAYFTADDGVNGRRIWRSDGTADGTTPIDILHGSLSADPLFIGCDGLLYYVTQEPGDETLTRYYVECSDGTAAGTKSLFSWQRASSTDSNAHFVNHTLSDGVSSRQAVVFAGAEPARMDELTGGVVANVVSDYTGSLTGLSSVQIGSQHFLYITTESGFNETTGSTLALGTQTGLAQLRHVYPFFENQIAILGTYSGNPRIIVRDRVTATAKGLVYNDADSLIACAGRMFYVNNPDHKLCVVEPGATPADAKNLKFDASTVAVDANGKHLFAAGGSSIFYVLYNGIYRWELWKLDASNNASVVKDFTTTSYDGPEIQAIASFGNGVVFLIKNADGFLQLWKSDGTEAGTQLVRSMNVTAMANAEIAVEGPRLFFTGDDFYGCEPWISDGTAAGTALVKNLSQAALPSSANIRTYFGFASTGEETFFTGQANDNFYLIRSDGTPQGTQNAGLIGSAPRRPATGAAPQPITSIPFISAEVSNGEFFMISPPDYNMGNADRLFFQDKASGGVRDLGTWYHPPASWVSATPIYANFGMTTLGDLLLLTDSDDQLRYQMWKSDGTLAGTTCFDINPSGCGAQLLGRVANAQFLAANDGTHGRELWRTNGTPGGTKMVKDIATGTADAFSITNVDKSPGAVLGNHCYFGASTPGTGYELWRTTGADAGTIMVKEIREGSVSSNPSNFTEINGKIVFAATDATAGTELFVSDGTANGTKLLKDINQGSLSSSPVFFSKHNGIAYYTATTVAEGTELWRTDGTEEGTFMLGDLFAGMGNLTYLLPGTVQDKVFFANRSFSIGPHALYATDGTVEGTVSLGNTGTDCDVVNGVFYFRNGTSLCRSYGTVVSTVAIQGLPTCYYLLGHAGNKLIFYGSLDGGPEQAQLYAYDIPGETAARRWNSYE